MNIYQAEKLLKDNCSRGFCVEGLGMLWFHVPKKSVRGFIELCWRRIPYNIDWHVLPLNTTSKKGNYAIVRHFDEKSINAARNKFPKIFKKV
jgi:hypothetical protein